MCIFGVWEGYFYEDIFLDRTKKYISSVGFKAQKSEQNKNSLRSITLPKVGA